MGKDCAHTWLLYWHREALVRPPTFKFYKDICTVTRKFVQRHYAGAEETLVRPEETRGRGGGRDARHADTHKSWNYENIATKMLHSLERRYSQVLET